MYKYLDNINSPKDIKNLSKKQLDELSNEIRKFLVKNISKTGGHLASNLGVVELTLAIHYVFDSPKDKIVFDVGHQTYIHKILTGRKDRFNTLRQYEGLSGFPKKKESVHDIFDTGHSSTSISSALGLSLARNIKNEKDNIIAVIGDGALTGGMAFEALNHLGHTKSKMIVILNDNEMSIDENVGSISTYLSKLRTGKTYNILKDSFEDITSYIPKIGESLYKTAEKFKDGLKSFITPGALFEEMGITYLGPIDGHNIDELICTLKSVKNIDEPILIHVITKKGLGYRYAENQPDKYHGVSPFNIEKGIESSSKVTYSSVVGDSMVNIAKKDKRVVAITAAMPSGTGLRKFKNTYPTRFFDVGIAEGHAVTLASGLAANGMKPYFAVYSTFLQRAYDQIIHDVAIQNLPITLLIDRAGIVGDDGETHNGVFDISYLSSIPNMSIMAPKDKKELEDMIEFSLCFDRPLAIRYPRGEVFEYETHQPIALGKWEVLTKGENVAIIATGNMVKNAIESIKILNDRNINPTLINARCLKPLDFDMIDEISKKYKTIVTIEDNLLLGGLGSCISLELIKLRYKGDILNIGFEDTFIEHGKVEIIHDKYGLSSKKIANRIIEFEVER